MKHLNRIVSAFLILTCLSAGKIYAAKSEHYDIGKMRYGVFVVAGLPEMTLTPYAFRNGKAVFDVSEYKWMDKVFLELKQAGFSMATLAYANSAYGHVYPPREKDIPIDQKWDGIDLVGNFLTAAKKYDMDAFLGTWVWRRSGDFSYIKRMTKDIIQKYKGHPQFRGFVPPVEIAWENFNEMAEYAKSLNPKLEIMDFPYGPYSARGYGIGILHGTSPNVDIENVQFKAAPPQLFSNDFMGVRGMTQSVLGGIPQKDVLIHTHYVIEGGLPYMLPSQAFHVKQGAMLTATPYGTHQFSFLEGFWGEASFRNGQPTLWRAIEYYKGILSVQRIAPYYTRATNTARVAIMVPQYPVCSSPDIVGKTWLHLARKQIPARFFLDQKNVGEPDIIIVPYTQGLSAGQIDLLREFTAKGGVTIAITGKETIPDYIQKVCHVDADSSQKDWRLAEIFGFGIYADRLEKEPFLVWNEPYIFEHQFGEGFAYAISGRNTIVPIYLPDIIQENLKSSLRVSGLPKNVIVERYEKSKGCAHELVLFLGTDENEVATDGKIFIPGADAADRYYWFDDVKAQLIPVVPKAGGVEIELPPIEDFGALIIVGEESTFPILLPTELYRECRSGETLELSAVLQNCSRKVLSGTLEVSAAPDWKIVAGAEQDYSLAPDEQKTFTVRVTVPTTVEKRPKFVKFSTKGLEQRTQLLVTDGVPHVITDREAPKENTDPYVRRRY